MARSSSLNVFDNQELAKSLSETCLVLLILVITSSHSSFINSDGSPSGDGPSLSWHLMCTVSIAASPTTKEGYGRWDEASERCCCKCHLSAARASLVTAIEKKIKDLGEKESCKPRASVWGVAPFYSAVQYWHVAPARLPVPLKKEICVSRLKIRRWWNTPRREECALSFLASRGINWTHFLLPFAGNQQKGNSSDLLGPGGGCVPGRALLFGVWCGAGMGSCWGCSVYIPSINFGYFLAVRIDPWKDKPCWWQLLLLQSFNSFVLNPKKLSGSLL